MTNNYQSKSLKEIAQLIYNYDNKIAKTTNPEKKQELQKIEKGLMFEYARKFTSQLNGIYKK